MQYQIDLAKRELPKIFTPAALVRITVMAIAVFLAASYLMPKLIQGFEFDWVSAFLKCMVCLAVILAMCCAMVIIPPMVTVSPDGIVVSEGKHCWRYKYSELVELRIEEGSSRWPTLVFRKPVHRSPRRFPISPSVSLDELKVLIERHKSKSPLETAAEMEAAQPAAGALRHRNGEAQR
ncbi:MAG: hypothetical protein U1F87_02975 [Kiritimatiellia bacterium]